MAFKLVAAFALVSVASAGLIPAPQVYHAAPAVAHYAAQSVLAKATDEYDPHPQYKYAYDVQDTISGDSKSQVEQRDGDVVRGEYSLIDADGFKRTVQYTADDVNGFNAVVHREPLVKAVAHAAPVHLAAAPVAVKTLAPVAHYAAPTIAKVVSPAYTTYSLPTAYVAHH